MRNQVRKFSVADLWQLISKQAPWKVHPGQQDDSLNFEPDVMVGARKRNPTRLLGSNPDFSSTITTAKYYGQEFRVIPFEDKYIYVGDGQLLAFDSNMNPIEIIDVPGDGFSYFDGINPLEDIDWASAIDTLIITNRTVTVTSEATPDYTPKGTVTFFSELPESPSDDDIYRVASGENSDPPGYYQYDADTETWTRIAAPADQDGRFTDSTLPCRLIWNEDANTFTFAELNLNDRLSGTTVSNPLPRFVGNKIKAVRYHGARLVFLSDNAVDMSRTSDQFTFFYNDISVEPTDDDRLYVDINIDQIGDALYCESLGKDLIILCESGVCSLPTGDKSLSPRNNPQIVFLSDSQPKDIRPASNGQQFVFIDGYNQVQVFQWAGLVYGIQPIGQANKYVQTLFDNETIVDIYAIENKFFFIADDGIVYHYTFYQSNGQLQAQSWGRYQYYGNSRILSMNNWRDRVYMVMDGPRHMSMSTTFVYPVPDSGFLYLARLDQLEVKTGTYDTNTDKTRFAHSASDADLESTYIVTQTGKMIRPISVDKRNAYFSGKIEGSCYIGFSFTSRTDLKKLYLGASTTHARLVWLAVHYQDSVAGMSVYTGRSYDNLKKARNSSLVLGSYTLNSSPIKPEKQVRHYFMGDARNTVIRIEDSTPGQEILSAIEFGFIPVAD